MLKNAVNVEKITREAVDAIVREFQPDKIILYGSRSSGEYTEESDVDILIIKDDPDDRIERVVKVGRIIRKWEKWLPFDLTVMTPDEVEMHLQNRDPFISHVMKNGKVLYG